MSRPIIEVTPDSSGGVVLTTQDRWLVEDLCEAVAGAISPKAFVALAGALADFNKADGQSVIALYQAREVIAREVSGKALTVARMLPSEAVGVVRELQNGIEASHTIEVI